MVRCNPAKFECTILSTTHFEATLRLGASWLGPMFHRENQQFRYPKVARP
jgi:hypothetical protein